MRSIAKPAAMPADRVVFLSVGIRADREDSDVAWAVAALKRAGFQAAPLNDETVVLLAERAEQIKQRNMGTGEQ